jgi:hypothetical protein
MATSKAGYGAIPPSPYITGGGVGASGQILTANGMNGSMWSSQTITAPTNAIQIGNPEPVITFHMNGNITTSAGTITGDDWIIAIQTMKRLIMDMSKDQELASKYPYIQDAAHSWFMKELGGNKNVKDEND